MACCGGGTIYYATGLGRMLAARAQGGVCGGACCAHKRHAHTEPGGDEAPLVNIQVGPASRASAGSAYGAGSSRKRIVAAAGPTDYTRSESGRVYRSPVVIQGLGGVEVRGSTPVSRSAGGLYGRSAGAPGDRVGVPSTWSTMSTPQRRLWAQGVARNQGWSASRTDDFVDDVLDDVEAALRRANILLEPPNPNAIRYPTAQEWATMGEPERRRWAQQAAEQQRLDSAQEQRFIADVIRTGVDGARAFITEHYQTERARIRANADVQVARYTGIARGERDYVDTHQPARPTTTTTTSKGSGGAVAAIGLGLLALRLLGGG